MANLPGKITIAKLLKDPASIKRLEDIKVEIQKEDQKYLAAHPEIRTLIRKYLRDILEQQPADVVQWTAEFFCQRDLKFVLRRQVELDKKEKVSSLPIDLDKILDVSNQLSRDLQAVERRGSDQSSEANDKEQGK